jgi:hypothetical protein
MSDGSVAGLQQVIRAEIAKGEREMHRPICGVASVAALLALAACGGGGGGGGGGSSGGSSPPPAQPAAGAPVPFQAPGSTVSYPVNSASVSTSAGAVTGSRIDATGNAGTITITTDLNGNLSAIQFNILTPTSTFTKTFPAGQIINQSQLLSSLATALNTVNTTPGQATFVHSTGGNLYSSYGAWASNDVGTGRFGVFALGSVTQPSAMPMTGTATYNGSTVGIAASSSASYALNGTVQLQANFATSTVGTAISNMQFQNAATNAITSQPNLIGTATITGNQYSGSLVSTTLAGTSTGTFYGPAANETAGVWKAAGGGVTAVGSYGASR